MPFLLLCGALLGATLASLPLSAQEAAAEAEVRGAEAEDPDSEGIQVHGRWVIEVRHPDGTVAERRTFENRLLPSGTNALVSVLSGNAPGNWAISFSASTGENPCGGLCTITVPGSAHADPDDSENLSVDVVDSSLELSGSETMDDDGQIGIVQTDWSTCDSTTTPADCDLGSAYTFTRRTLETPIDVASGQSVSVTVIISFTSG